MLTFPFLGHKKTAGSEKVLRVLSTLPRAGTHWLVSMISYAMRVPACQDRIRDRDALKRVLTKEAGKRLCFDHFDFSLHGDILDPNQYKGLHIVLLYRHPVDAMISQFYSRIEKGTLPHPELSALDNFKLYLKRSEKTGKFREFVRLRVVEWLKSERVFPVRYEDLVQNTAGQLARVLDYFQIRYKPKQMEKAVWNNRFDVLSGGRLPGEEDERSHYRKGIPGEWKYLLNGEEIESAKRQIGDYFELLGYEV